MEKTEKFERIEKHLYIRQYRTSTGCWSTLYYAKLTDRLKGKPRTFPLGSDLKEAREQLQILEARNIKREDFDADKAKPVAESPRLTFRKWSERYLELVQFKKSQDRDRQLCDHLNEGLGDLELTAISRSKVMEYKNLRLQQPIQRHGKPVEGTKVALSTINRELSCLRHMLRLAADDGLIESPPVIKLESEKHLSRERVLSTDEYKTLLDNSPRWLQRPCIAAYEGCLTQGDILRLTWNAVDRREGMIKVPGGRKKTGVKQTPPITAALAVVLDELKAEYRSVPNTDGRVFTRNGKRVTKDMLSAAFNRAKAKAGIKDFTFHDFRHTCITRWAEAGVPVEIAMMASGHGSVAMHYRYTNLRAGQVREVFDKILTGVLTRGV